MKFFVSFYFDWQKRGQILCYNSLPPPPPTFPTHPPKMELGSRALDQNVYSIRCWRWKLPKFRLCPKEEWFTFGQFSILPKGLTQYRPTFYEFQASHLQWYFSSEGILASVWSRYPYMKREGWGFLGTNCIQRLRKKQTNHAPHPTSESQ